MKSREQQRAEILNKLKFWEGFQKEDGWGSTKTSALWTAIRSIMEMVPESCNPVFYNGKHHKYILTTGVKYSKIDNKKVYTIISRMEAQGYIKVNGEYFEILKTE